jgi:hypothetical protein
VLVLIRGLASQILAENAKLKAKRTLGIPTAMDDPHH